jgi:hypothetical protein
MCDDGAWVTRDGNAEKFLCVARLGQPLASSSSTQTSAGKNKGKKALKRMLRPNDVLSLPSVALAAPLSLAALEHTASRLLSVHYDVAWVKQHKEVRVYKRTNVGEVRPVLIDWCCVFMRAGMFWITWGLPSH